MKIKAHYIASASLLIFFQCQFASAAPAADTNEDSVISKDEFMAASAMRFKLSDRDGDHVLSKKEISHFRKARRSQQRSSNFNSADINNDGMIDRDEFTKYDFRKHAPDHSARVSRPNKRNKKRANRRKQGPPDRYQGLDRNKDGQITLPEYQSAAEQLFLKLDTNDDGVLTKGENKKARR